ncbi:hypothetical protein [Carnobacterium sp. 17-4]|uniref:hypothetical protein n=1 Tax=Carnobacterium sp. (strain 17-4) TaxID=208596 RepID=UPI00031063CD|nr:hypothetical protein [Carnobacterium sp. 17-4]
MLNLFDYGWLTLGSLIFGLIAWFIPIFNIIRRKKRGNSHSTMIVLSMGSCATALWFQISYTNYLVTIQDISALMDTTSTSNWISAVLLIITITLNVTSIILHKDRTSE